MIIKTNELIKELVHDLSTEKIDFIDFTHELRETLETWEDQLLSRQIELTNYFKTIFTEERLIPISLSNGKRPQRFALVPTFHPIFSGHVHFMYEELQGTDDQWYVPVHFHDLTWITKKFLVRISTRNKMSIFNIELDNFLKEFGVIP